MRAEGRASRTERTPRTNRTMAENPYKAELLQCAFEQGRTARRSGRHPIYNPVMSSAPARAYLAGYHWRRGEPRWKLQERLRKLVGTMCRREGR